MYKASPNQSYMRHVITSRVQFTITISITYAHAKPRTMITLMSLVKTIAFVNILSRKVYLCCAMLICFTILLNFKRVNLKEKINV